MPISVGTSFDHYEVLSLIGIGGMGEVFLTRDTRLDRKVALKFLPEELTDHKDRLKRFEQEARAASALNHPNILTIYEIGKHDSSNFMAMEFVDGVTLREKIDKGQMPPSEIIDIATQVASALSSAHEAGIIHRDIKPDNVMVRNDGFVKVLDFGLAKLIELDEDIHNTDSEAPTRAHVKTNPGAIMGSASYMSPEQVRGKNVDARTDIFSFGIVLYEMLSGKKPFVGDSPFETMSAILKEEPPDFPDSSSKYSPALKRIAFTCLEKKPERRFYSAHDLGLALSTLSTSTGSMSQTGTQFRAEVSSEEKKLSPSSRAGLAWGIAGLFALLSLAALFFAWNQRSENSQRVFSQLNFRREAIFQAGFAPDGKTIVYSAATEDNIPEIFTLHPEFPVPQTVGAPGMHLLDVSSKGELAILVNAKYIWHRMFSGTLAQMPLVGGAPREILENVRQASWSPDGSQLAIIREVDGKDRLEYPIGKVLCEVGGYLSDLRISPDGNRIAFFEHPRKWDDRGSVNVVDLDGNKTLLTDGYWSERGLAWSADGNEVLFSAGIGGGAYTIYAVALDGTRRIVDQSPGGLILQDVAPDGRWLANRIDFRYAAMVHTPTMKEDRDLSWLRTSHSKVLSQDGQSLLFAETSAGSNYAVCLRKTDGSPVVRLGEGNPTDLSRDGKSALAIVPSKPAELVIYPTGAGERQHLERGNLENYSSAQFFRDGNRVLIGGNEAGKPPRFYVQDLKGGAPRAITPEGTRDGKLSPDEKHLLARDPFGKYFLYPVEGGEPRAVSALSVDDVLIQWSADGRSWFVYRGSAIPCRIERVNAETGRRELFKEVSPAIRTGLLAVRPTFITDDERSYAYTTYQQVSSLFVTQNPE